MRREFHVDRAIRGERETRAANAVIATLATRQHGVVSRDQLRAVGLGDDSIDRLIQAKRLHPLHRSVYAVGHRRLSRAGRYLAAVLASGEGAVLSHRSAADLWELRATKEPEIDVIAPTHRRGDPAIEVHAHAMEHTETTTREAIRVTKPLRTLLDLAACVDEKELERAIRQAVYHRLTTTTLLAEAVHERRGHRGMKTMRKALIHAGEAPGRTRSELEDDFLHFLRKHRLPMPELNVKMRIRGRPIEADCVWREKRLIVELDGRAAHDSTPAFESDRARDSALAAATWCVVRVTSARMSTDGRRLARELRTLLA